MKKPSILIIGLCLSTLGQAIPSFAASVDNSWPSFNSHYPKREFDPAVSAIQYLLKARGFYKYKVDGIYGARTIAAIKSFQRAKKLKVDGIAGGKTLAALVIKVQRGSRGDAVRAVQILLRYSYDHVEGGRRNRELNVDGIFGPETEQIVKWAQGNFNLEKEQLKEDGIVGPITWRFIFLDAV